MKAAVQGLLAQPGIWLGKELMRTSQPGLSTGFAMLDAELPGGGWPVGGMAEVLTARHGLGELSLLLPALATLTRGGQRVALVAPPFIPYAPALAAAGVRLDRLLWVRAEVALIPWAIEQTLKSGACAAVAGWPVGRLQDKSWRRLQLAAEAGHSTGFVLREPGVADASSPVMLRLAFEARMRLRILKRRGPPLLHPLQLEKEQSHVVARTVLPAARAGMPERRLQFA